MLTHQLESAIFHFLKKHYFVGAYFPYSFIKAHFYNETTGNIRKAIDWLIDDKLIERIGKGEYKFINNESPSHFEIKEEKNDIDLPDNVKDIILNFLNTYFIQYNVYPKANILIDSIQKITKVESNKIKNYLKHLVVGKIIKINGDIIVPIHDSNKIDKWLIELIIQTIKKFYNYSNKYPSEESIYFYSRTNSSKEKVFHHIQYMIENCIVVKDEDGKIIPYEYKLKEESKPSSNQEININTEIRKIYGYITKKNKELKIEIEKDIEESFYSAGREMGEFHGKAIGNIMKEINQINEKLNYQNQQKDKKIRSLNDKIKTLRKDINTLIQETKSLKCQNIKKE